MDFWFGRVRADRMDRLISSSCLRNVVSMFHVIEKEMRWRREMGQPEGFDMVKKSKPIVAVGAEKPLGDQTMLADYFRM
jgi:hypothetical protein